MGKILKIVIGIALTFTGIGAPIGALLGVSAATVGLFGISLVLSGVSDLFNGGKAQTVGKDDPIDPGQKLNLRVATGALRDIAYGTVASGGYLVFRETTGANSKYLHMVTVICGHEINAVTGIRWAGETVTFTSNEAKNGKWRQFINLGDPADTAFSELVSATAKWTSDHIGQGLASVYNRFEYDPQGEFKSGLQEVVYIFEARKLYDPRKDSTNGGSGAHRIHDETTYEFSDNSALCLLDYMLGHKENSKRIFGKNVTASLIDWPVWVAAINACDEDVTLDAGGTEKRYTCNGFVNAGDSHRDNINKFLNTMAGEMVFQGGVWRLFAGVARPVGDVRNADHFLSSLTYEAKKSLANKRNGIRGDFYDPNNNYQLSPYPTYQNATYLANDGGHEQFIEADFPMTNSVTMAQRLAKIELGRGRMERIVHGITNLIGLKDQAGDVVQIDYPRFNLINQEMKITSWALKVINDENGQQGIGIQQSYVEEDSTIYDWAAAEEGTIAPPGTLNHLDRALLDYKDIGGVKPMGFNLIDPTQWVIGTTGSQGDFIENSDTNTIILGVGPYDTTEPIWEAKSDGGNDASGGWNLDDIEIDHKKSYRSIAFFKQTSNSGSIYLGCATGGQTLNLADDSVNGNPYFWLGDGPVIGRWYAAVGITHGSGYAGGDLGIAGVYDVLDGTKVLDGTEFKNAVGALTQYHRCYQYYATTANNIAYFTRPRFEVMDGSEPPLSALMSQVGVYRDVIFKAVPTGGVPATPTGDTPAGWLEYVPSGGTVFSSNTFRRLVDDTVIGAWAAPKLYSGYHKGAYSDVETYFEGDRVGYLGSSFICTNPSATGIVDSPPPSTATANTDWDLLSGKGEGEPVDGGPITAVTLVKTGGSSGSVTVPGGSGSASPATLHPTPTGGDGGPYTYLWTRVGADSGSITNSSTTGATLTLYHSGCAPAGGGSCSANETWNCKMTDGSSNATSSNLLVAMTVFGDYEPDCYAFGTKVKMWDGTEKNIEDVIVGDELLGFSSPGMIDEDNPSWAGWESLNLIGGTNKKVTVTRSQPFSKSVWTLNGLLPVSQYQPMLVYRDSLWQWARGEDLLIGDLLHTKENSTLEITTIDFDPTPVDVQDLGVETVDTYYVKIGDVFVLGHNK